MAWVPGGQSEVYGTQPSNQASSQMMRCGANRAALVLWFSLMYQKERPLHSGSETVQEPTSSLFGVTCADY